MYVLEQVLEKAHRALRNPGLLLNIQPSHKNALVSVEHGDEVLLSGTLEEPNFRAILIATQRAIKSSVTRGLYTIVATSLDDYGEDYFSLDEWLDVFLPFSEDAVELNQMADAIRLATASLSGDFVIKHRWEEQATLFMKQG